MPKAKVKRATNTATATKSRTPTPTAVRATPNSDTSDSSPDHNETPPFVGEPMGPIPTQLNFDEDDSNIVQPSAALAVVASQPRSTPPPVPQQNQRPQFGAAPPAAQANQNVQAWQPPPSTGQRADDDNVQDAAQPQAAPARRMITIPEILRAHSNGLAELPCYDPTRPLDADEALSSSPAASASTTPTHSSTRGHASSSCRAPFRMRCDATPMAWLSHTRRCR
jgi:hypothetical protein